MKAQHSTLSTTQNARLTILVDGLNLVHGIRTDADEDLRIRTQDIYIRQKHEGVYDFRDSRSLLVLTPDVLEEGYVRALHICFEQLMRSIGEYRESKYSESKYSESKYSEGNETYIPPVVQYVLDHAKEFKQLIMRWNV